MSRGVTSHLSQQQAEVPEKPKSLLGEIWRGIDSEFKQYYPQLRLAETILFFLPSLAGSRIRTAIYRLLGVHLEKGTIICGNLTLSGRPGLFRRLRFGADCFVNAYVHFDLNDDVILGNNVNIGHHVIFITTNHEIGPPENRCGVSYTRPINVEDGCWIGANVTILPGVRIGKGSVVGAGALVTKDVPPNSLIGGVPAKVLRTLS